MKIFARTALLLVLIAGAVSCKDREKSQATATAMGSPYEVLVICNQEKWDGEVGDTLRSILEQPIDMLNQVEPMFRVSRIQPNSFANMLKKMRNVLNVITGSDYDTPSMTAHYDVYAIPQIIVTVSGPDDASIVNYMSQYRDQLQSIFMIAERDRSLEANARYGETKIKKEILEKFGFNLDLNKGYRIRNTEQDFMWISHEHPTASQGVIIYSYPYSGKENFTTDSLLARRSQFVALIPGENPGSHMITAMQFTPELKHLRINGRYWAELRGFWDVQNDYMGGPFVSYSTLDIETNRVVTLDFYVYSPQLPKRNFLRGLENLIYSVSFPSDANAAGQQGGISYAPSAGGKASASPVGSPYEVLLSCAREHWNGPAGSALEEFLEQPVEALNQYEPFFDVHRTEPGALSRTLRKMRNIIEVRIGEQYERTDIIASYDLYASSQLVVTVCGPDDASVADYLTAHGRSLQSLLMEAERKRELAAIRPAADLTEHIRENFGFDINLGKGYRINNMTQDFMWLSQEHPTASQGVVIYSYPYSGGEDFTAAELIKRRDQFASMIPGENPGSHMITFDGYVPQVNMMSVNGRQWSEMRGFWDVKGDYMGGPFVSYSTFDAENGRMVALDFYVYSPEKPKRNFMRSLENLVYSVSFPSDGKMLTSL